MHEMICKTQVHPCIVLHLFAMIKSLPNVLILYSLGPLMNFQINI